MACNNLFAMAQNRDKIVSDLRTIAAAMLALADDLGGKAAEIPQEIAGKVSKAIDAGECLQCGRVKDEAYRRGLCGSCYRKSRDAVKSNKTNWAKLMAKGLASEPHQGGRPSDLTKLDVHLGRVAPSFEATLAAAKEAAIRQTKGPTKGKG